MLVPEITGAVLIRREDIGLINLALTEAAEHQEHIINALLQDTQIPAGHTREAVRERRQLVAAYTRLRATFRTDTNTKGGPVGAPHVTIS